MIATDPNVLDTELAGRRVADAARVHLRVGSGQQSFGHDAALSRAHVRARCRVAAATIRRVITRDVR
jgi:hypothetical protein